MEKEEWVAINDETDEIVASGSNITEVIEKAKAKGIDDPYITPVLPKDTEMFF